MATNELDANAILRRRPDRVNLRLPYLRNNSCACFGHPLYRKKPARTIRVLWTRPRARASRSRCPL